MNFLETVADEIIKRLDDDNDFAVVCPNKRTIEYIKAHIGRKAQKTMFLPDFITPGNLYSYFSPLKRADNLVLILELFKVFKRITKDDEVLSQYDFESFQTIGEILLKDFNDIDNYLVDINLIFRNISDYESIDFMEQVLSEEQIETLRNFFAHFSKEKITEEKQYFMRLWSVIPQLYTEFTKELKQKNIGYNGLIIRDILNKFEAKIKDLEVKTFIFVGFNALTFAQQQLFLKIKSFRKALFYWDYDNFYYKNTLKEAGFFIRQNINILGDDLKIERDNFEKDKNIKLVGFPLSIAQTKALPQLLQMTGTEKFDDGKTAVIMPDESLLFPVLSSLPDFDGNVNVTIGLPFNNTNTAALVFNWLKMMQKYSSTEYFLKDDLLQFFNNKILYELSSDFEKFVDEITKNNILRYDDKNLQFIENQLIKTLLSKENIKNPLILCDTLIYIAEQLYFLFVDNNSVEVEAIYGLYTFMLNFKNTLENDISQDFELLNAPVLIKILMQNLNNIHIPFSGKTLDGLQVMTLMESRNLDFENVILLNLNEGIMPPKPSRTSLISEFMRKSFGLPLLPHRDAIFAYLFYRLFHNAKNIVLAYSNVGSDKFGEMSRFVQQLIYETNLIPQQNRYFLSEKIVMPSNSAIEIYKTDDIYKKLLSYLDKKMFSASSLNTYLACPLKFYYQYIARIKEPQGLDTFEIDDMKLGSIFHNTMEYLYKPFENKEVTKIDIKNLLKQVDEKLNKALLENLGNSKDALNIGINLIIKDVIKKYVINTLNFDLKKAPFYILGLEKKIFTKLDFIKNDKKYSVNFVGIIDRMDEKDKKIQIIDYKTGSDEIKFNTLEQLFIQRQNHKAIFQLMIYTKIVKELYPNSLIEPHIYKIREIRSAENTAIIKKKNILNTSDTETFENFYQMLDELLNEIFDKDIPFSQTELVSHCLYCPYNAICQR